MSVQRFTAQRSPVTAQRFHGVPRRDVAGRVHVSVAGETAGYAPERRLALAGFPGDVPARAAALRGERGRYLLHPPGGLVLQPVDRAAPSRPCRCPGCGRPSARRSGRARPWAPGGPRHALDVEVLDADHVEAPREVRGGLLRPVLAPVRLPRFQPRHRGLRLAAAARATLRPGESCARRSAAAAPPARTGGTVQHLSGGQGGADLDAPVDPHDRAGPRPWHGAAGITANATCQRPARSRVTRKDLTPSGTGRDQRNRTQPAFGTFTVAAVEFARYGITVNAIAPSARTQ